MTLPAGRGVPFKLAWDSTWERPRSVTPVYAPGATTSLHPLSMRVYLT